MAYLFVFHEHHRTIVKPVAKLLSKIVGFHLASPVRNSVVIMPVLGTHAGIVRPSSLDGSIVRR